MSSIEFNPETGDITPIDSKYKELYGGVPFVRKILSHNLNGKDKSRQNIEIEIVTKIKENKKNNLVDIYDIQEPTDKKNGYIDMELLQTFVNEIDYKLNEKNILFLNKLEGDVKRGLEQLHSLCIVYIDLHIGNVGWSIKDECWKIFDFNMSGILEVDSQKECTNEWYQKGLQEYEPDSGIFYNKIKKEKGLYNKFDYDNKAKELFDKERNKKEKEYYCKQLNILNRKKTFQEGEFEKIKEFRKKCNKSSGKKRKNTKNNKKRKRYKKSLKKKRGGCNDEDFWANLHLHI